MSSIDIPQGSDEWKLARVGRVTASRVADVVAKAKSGGVLASRSNYLAELLVERLTGIPTEGFMNAAMQWGVDQEGPARITYELLQDCTVQTVGFVPHPMIEMAGASPDGLIGEDGQIEIKCPNSATHLETLRTGTIAGKYITQMQFQMACTGRAWCDWMSFDPRMPPALRLFVLRVERNDEIIDTLESAVIDFIAELDATIADLGKRYGAVPADAARIAAE